MVGLESIGCSNIVVFGKARKIVGGEGSKRPFEVLSRPLEPLDKPRTRSSWARCSTGPSPTPATPLPCGS